MLQRPTPVVLTIAGSDCTAGAGLQADIKTCAAMGVYACSVVTAVTAQNPYGVQRIEIMPRAIIAAQLSSVMAAYPVSVIKIGMLGNVEVAEEIASFLRTSTVPVVIDPVLSASAGGILCADDALVFYREQLLPLATVLTPNLSEASLLLGQPIANSHEAYEAQALALLEFGSQSVLLKGGHSLDQRLCSDYLAQMGMAEVKAYSAARLQTPHGHGTGCTLASAIAAGLAQGLSLLQAVAAAKNYLQGSLANAARLNLVPEYGPVHHFSTFW
ncbi:MAG: bifunctional hydroxymethylpyrimidine kinase/phosphomethylpyrimidine kinase [Marinagarivorans sp.]|nr:bifunctional hydroxymethylpyrimidine kinase/phosphomethylpyrimidine kinase [Marinagarivorans sp.]